MLRCLIVSGIGCLLLTALSAAQEKSVRPGVNDSFQNPDVKEFVGRFEVESREVYTHREQIVAACGILPGQTIADIGAGTGLFTRLFAKATGPEGRVIAVDIAQKFLDHIELTSREAGLKNVDVLLCSADSTRLPAESVDMAFICDTYHHFEFPLKTMASLRTALKPKGRVILIDFRREEGQSSEWVLNHVRAGQSVFEAEIERVGFRKLREVPDVVAENYFVVFEKVDQLPVVSPVIPGHGGVVLRPQAVEPPRAGAKVLFDVTANSADSEPNKGLDRVARLLNLYGAHGLEPQDIQICVVLHGDATRAALGDADYQKRFGPEKNPNLPLIAKLRAAGVDIQVCGQALNYKGIADAEVEPGISIAAAALTTIIHKQAEGYSYLPLP